MSGLVLLAVTWRLWGAQDSYPQVPAFEMFCAAPHWLDVCLLFGLVLGLLGVAASSYAGRHGAFIGSTTRVATLIALAGLFVLDQHRFQPWAYLLGLLMAVWLVHGDRWRLTWMRWLLISIYVYSAMGKFDVEFLYTVGQQMLRALLNWTPIAFEGLSQGVRLTLVFLFPLAELLIGIGLMLPRIRKYVGIAAIAFHIGLVFVLGPTGLNHRPGVLVWNMQIALQVYWVFVAAIGVHQTNNLLHCSVDAEQSSGIGESTSGKVTLERSGMASPVPCTLPSDTAGEPSLVRKIASGFVHGICGLAIGMPALERIELWDHWPSWALYAPHSSRVRVQMATTQIAELPEALQKLVSQRSPSLEDAALDVWVDVPIDAWSLAVLDTPVYPQSRFQLGVARALMERSTSAWSIRVTVLGIANRFNGERATKVLHEKSEVENYCTRFWLNTRPRRPIR